MPKLTGKPKTNKSRGVDGPTQECGESRSRSLDQHPSPGSVRSMFSVQPNSTSILTQHEDSSYREDFDSPSQSPVTSRATFRSPSTETQTSMDDNSERFTVVRSLGSPSFNLSKETHRGSANADWSQARQSTSEHTAHPLEWYLES